MATELKSPPEPRTSRSERAVEDQINRIEKQIRWIDVGTGVFGLLVMLFAYGLIVILLDRFLTLSSLARQFLFAGFAVSVGWWIYKRILTPLVQSVNPIYAALILEQAIPDAKNSLVNWVDLKNDRIPESVKLALGKRAAKDLKPHEDEEFVSSKQLFMIGTLAGGLFFALVILMVIFGKAPFFSMLGRTFTPFIETTIATRNTVAILTPEQGNITVAMGMPIDIVAKVTGKLPSAGSPESPRLMMRYHENEPWQTKFLGAGELSSEHKIRIPSSEVRSGFSYMVAAGDAKTKDYQVDVRLTPLIVDFQAAYKYRAYTGLPEATTAQRKISAPAGSAVKIRVRANCAVKDGTVRFFYGKDKTDKVYLIKSPSDPSLMEASFVLSQSGTYQIEFTSSVRDEYVDAMPAPLEAIADAAPTVDLMSPGKEATASVNGVLDLEAKIVDDFGVNKVVLKMIASGDRPLRPQVYRDEKALKLPSGGNLPSLLYKDFINIASLQAEDGLAYKATSGSYLDYWLEAEDACDFPKANLGKSKVFRLTFADRAPDEQAKKDKEKAEEDKKQNEQKQDEKLKKENQQREEQKKNPQDQKNSDEKQQPGQQGEKAEGKESADKADGGNQGEGKGQEKSKNDEKGKGSPDNKGNDKDAKNDPMGNNEDFKDQEKRLNDALAKNNPDNSGKDDKNPMGKDPADKKGDSKGNENKDDAGKNDAKGLDKNMPKGNDPKGNDPKGNDPKGNDPKGNDPKGNDPKGNDPKGNDPKGNDPKGNDPKGNDPKGNDPKGNDPKGNDPKGNDPKGNDPKGNDPKGNDPKGNDPKGNDPKGNDPKGNDPKGNDPKGNDPKGNDPKGNDPKGNDPKGMNPKGNDPKGNDPKGMNPKGNDPKGNDPKGNDPKGNDPKGNDPKGNDPKGNDPKGNDPKGNDPKGNDPKGNDPKGNDPKGNDPKGNDPKGTDPKGNDPKGNDPKGNDPKGNDPKGNDPKGNDPKGNDPKGNDPKVKTPDAKGMEEKGGAPKSGDNKQGQPMGKDNKGLDKPMEGKDGKPNGKEGEGKGKEGMGKDGEGKGKEGQGKDGDAKGKEGMGKDGEGKGKEGEGKGKEGEGKGKEGEGKGKEGEGKGKEGMGKGKEGEGKEGEGKGKEGMGKDGKPNGGDKPGPGGTDDRKPNDAAGVANPNAKTESEAASEENKRKAVQLQLDNYKKRLSPDVLKDAKISPEDLQRFLDEKKRRIEAELGVKEKDAAAQSTGKGPSLGGRRYESNGGEKNDSKAPNLAKPPAAYRDAYKEFTKKLAQPE